MDPIPLPKARRQVSLLTIPPIPKTAHRGLVSRLERTRLVRQIQMATTRHFNINACDSADLRAHKPYQRTCGAWRAGFVRQPSLGAALDSVPTNRRMLCRMCSPASSDRNGRKANRRPRVTRVASWKSAQRTRRPRLSARGRSARRIPGSVDFRRHIPLNKLMVTANRLCTVPLVVLSR
jgi:hypothetical protein